MAQNRAAGQKKLLEVAMNGNPGAMTQLGAALYERGDKVQAASWLHKGATMEYAPSIQLMERLGLTHIGVQPSLCRCAARVWLTWMNMILRSWLVCPSCRRCARR